MENETKFNISIILDARRKKSSGKFPAKLRVYSKTNSKAKLYYTEKDLTKSEFQKFWIDRGSSNLRGQNLDIRNWLQSYETRASDEAKKLNPFSFDAFERRFFRRSGDANDVFYHYGVLIKENLDKGKIGTSESFRYSLMSIKEFVNHNKEREAVNLPYQNINSNWLAKYEAFMLEKGKSITSVGIYLRALRTVFNRAINDNDVMKELYPFGQKSYQIPSSKKVRKVLNSEELRKLYEAVPKTPQQQRAKDFWFFSYSCSGMNVKDILLLKRSDLKEDKFSYYRAKTFSKSKVKSKIEVFLNDYSRTIIEKYGSDKLNSYVFPIIKELDSEEVRYAKTKNYTRLLNQHLKILATKNGLSEDISMYWARHSFATNSIRKGASMEFISDALNHSDLKVTRNYFAGFEDKAKKEFANKLMEF